MFTIINRKMKCQCGLDQEKVYSQTSQRIIGHICKNGHYWTTAYGKQLLIKKLPKKILR